DRTALNTTKKSGTSWHPLSSKQMSTSVKARRTQSAGAKGGFFMSVRLIAAIAAVCLSTSGAFAQNAGKPTDPQIAHIAYTAGQIDIEAAQQALNKSQNKDVREFANDMERDHKAVNDKALALVKKLNVTPQDNDTSKALSKQAADKRAELAKLNGAAFDKAY